MFIPFLKKIKPDVVGTLRSFPYSDKVLGIPKKRISPVETAGYFSNNGSGHNFYKNFGSENIALLPPKILNKNRKGKENVEVHECEKFLVQLKDARFNKRPFSIFTRENYHLAIVSSHPELNMEQHIAFNMLYYPRPKRISGISLLLVTQDDNNYCHCLFQITAKIWFLRNIGFDLEKVDHFLININTSGFQKEILASLDLPHEKFLDISNYKHVKMEKLVITPSFCDPEPWMIPLLQKSFLKKDEVVAPDPSDKRIFVSRNKAKFRKIINEDFLWGILQRHNFKYVRTEEMSIKEEAEVFAKAEMLISAHGAALANTAFCKPGTKVLEIRAVQHDFLQYRLFENLSSMAGLKHFTLLCSGYPSEHSRNALDYDLLLDEDGLEETVLEFINDK